MQINSINNQNFKGTLSIPQSIKTPLERGIQKVLRQENKDFSTIPNLIVALQKKPNATLKVVAKSDVIKPLSEADYDVFIGNTPFNTRKIENGSTLAEKFINGLYEVTK